MSESLYTCPACQNSPTPLQQIADSKGAVLTCSCGYMKMSNPLVIAQPIGSTAQPLVISSGSGELIVTVHKDHTVTLHRPDLVNEAAKLFWEAIQNFGVSNCVQTHKED